MSKKASPTLIGGFVVVGLALLVASIVVFSPGGLFTPSTTFILYFDASLEGLRVGAPVKFRGVPIGEVIDVLIRHNQAEEDRHMPVLIRVFDRVLERKAGKAFMFTDPVVLKAATNGGLRAQLDTESIVTGVLFVNLKYVSEAPKAVWHQRIREYPEIPTEPTTIQELYRNLAEVDVKNLVERLNVVLGRLDAGLANLDVRAINAGVTNLLSSVDRTLGGGALSNALEEVRLTLTELRQTAAGIRTNVVPLAADIQGTLAQATETLRGIQVGVEDVRDTVSPTAPLTHELNRSLSSLAEATEAFRDLAEYLQRNPNALISGRKRRESSP